MDFEDILLELGDDGTYQKRLILFFLLPSSSMLSWFAMNILFMLSVPDHWCNVPEVATSNLTIEQQRGLISPPFNPKCYMYDINYTDYLDSGIYTVPNDTNTKPCTNGWQFDKTNYDATAATVWNMYCEDDHYPSFVLTFAKVGTMCGTTIFGRLSDRIGRKMTFFSILVATAVNSLASVLVTDFTAFVILRAINSGLISTLFQLPYIIVLELVAPEMRTHMSGLGNCCWTVGMSVLPLIAYLTRNWVILGVLTSSMALVFVLYWRFLPESPRWLLSQERYDEALVILKKIGETNGKAPNTEQLLAKLKIVGEKIRKEKTEDNVQNSPVDIFRYPQLRKMFIIICICRIADAMAYDGLQINVTYLAGNEFFNFFLTAIAEIPGYVAIWFLLDRLGRRWCTAGGFLMTGFVCLIPAFVSGLPYADITCSMLGKFCVSAAFMATYQQSSELYPTVVRSLGMGMSATVSSTVSLGIPYIVYLRVYGKAIPFIVFGSIALIAGVSASFLPETLNENLPQTISDAEELGKNQKYFSWNRRRRSVCRERAASLKVFDNLRMKEGEEVQGKPVAQIIQNDDSVKKRNVSTDSDEKKANRSSMEPGLNDAPKKPSVTYRHSLSASATESSSQPSDNCIMPETYPAAYEQHVGVENTDKNSETNF